MSSEEEVGIEAMRDEIAEEMVRVHDESYGESIRKAHVIIDGDFVIVIIDSTPTLAEQTLLDAGRGDAVKDTREAFQDAIGATFNAIVERATGRRVESFSSRMSIEPMYAVELFRLAPHT
jgi:uncharacterized protein YbcI